jgi:hypothetical protein
MYTNASVSKFGDRSSKTSPIGSVVDQGLNNRTATRDSQYARGPRKRGSVVADRGFSGLLRGIVSLVRSSAFRRGS